MKILHTADWHLGKSFGRVSRIKEQRECIDELVTLCRNKGADVVLICGDVYDTFLPKSEAEELFFDAAVRLAETASVIVLSGNHDDAARLSAPYPVAKAGGVYLCGGMDNEALSRGKIRGGKGYLRFETPNETVNFMILPFPSYSGVMKAATGGSFEERVKSLIDICAARPDGDTDIFASHLFVTGAALADEKERGAVSAIGAELLPKCDYTALGHIHRPQTVSRSRNIYYSGSLLKYSLDDVYDKEFLMYDTESRSVERFPIKSGRKLLSLEASCADEAEELLKLHADALLEVVYDGAALTPAAVNKLKSYENFAAFRPVIRNRADRPAMEQLSDAQLFRNFYQEQRGVAPDSRLEELFLSLVEGK